MFRCGWAMDRPMSPSRVVKADSLALDPEFYKDLYSDLDGLSHRQLQAHWRETGQNEGRFASEAHLRVWAEQCGIPTADFSKRQYLALNPDLPDSFDVGSRALHHFVTAGWSEGRPSDVAAELARRTSAVLDDYMLDLVAPLECRDTREHLVLLHQIAKGRLPSHEDLQEWHAQLASESASASDLFMTWAREELVCRQHDVTGHESASHPTGPRDADIETPLRLVDVPGRSQPIDPDDWHRRWAETEETASIQDVAPFRVSEEVNPDTSPPSISVLVSLYRPETFLSDYLENLGSQDILHQCEVIFVLCEPSQEVLEQVQGFADTFPRTIQLVFHTRVSIYEAWNAALRASNATLITNANVDDSRRPDSLSRQRALLESDPKIDVVYQDYFVSLEPHLPWDILESLGETTDLPTVAPETLLDINSPHCAPMWRRGLHDELGYFDGALESAGDYDFWLRCLIAGKKFAKDDQVHAAYYVNPHGMSTKQRSPGDAEGREIRRKYWWVMKRLGFFDDASRPAEVSPIGPMVVARGEQ